MSPSNEYAFVTRWRVEASIEEVSEILDDAEGLARWWPSVYLGVHKRPDGVVDLYTKGWLPYTLRWSFRVVDNRHPHGFTIEASGDFEGTGVWTFEPEAGGTHVRFDWNIVAEKPLQRVDNPAAVADGVVDVLPGCVGGEPELRLAALGIRHGAHLFLTENAAALEQAGFGVLLPSWWTGKGTRLRLGVRAQVRSPKMKEPRTWTPCFLKVCSWRASASPE